MNTNKILFIILFFLFVPANFLCSQTYVPSADTSGRKKLDTVAFKLKFTKADTLIYNVNSRDSIAINYGAPLIKTWNEVLKVVCDSVGINQNFYLTLEMIDFKSSENYGVHKNVEVTESPWLNRKIHLQIDSMGKRIGWDISDSVHPGISPGGAFQPFLFFWFKENLKAIDETWLVHSTEELPENGLPVPVLKQSSLFRARAPLDTLGDSCNAFEFIRTGQGDISLKEKSQETNVHTIMNGFGLMYIGKKKEIPLYYHHINEQKLSISVSEDDKQPGWHNSTVTYTLSEIRPYVPEIKTEKDLKQNKGKPNTKSKKK